MPSSYIAAAMPVEAHPSVSSVTPGSPVSVSGWSSTLARKSRIPCITSSTEPPSGQLALVDAELRPRPGRGLEPLGLAEVDLLRGEVGGDDAVEDEATDELGEQVGVRRAEVGPVGLAEVVQLLLAEGRTQDVHVLGRVDGRDVPEQGPGVGAALLREALPALRRTPRSSPASSGVGSTPRRRRARCRSRSRSAPTARHRAGRTRRRRSAAAPTSPR